MFEGKWRNQKCLDCKTSYKLLEIGWELTILSQIFGITE